MMRKLCLTALLLILPFTLLAGPFELEWKRDSLALSAGLATSFIIRSADKGHDEWDGTTLDSSDINALDRFFAHGYRRTPDRLSYASAGVAVALPLISLKENPDEWLTLSVMLAESLIYTDITCNAIKVAVERERPYMYYSSKSDTGDDRLYSFPSLHTATAFAGAAFASYTYAAYNPDSKYRYAVAATAYGFAAATGALRIGAGKHFFTDVLTGAAIGSFWGYMIPKLHEVKEKADNRVLDALDIAPGYVGFTVGL